MRITRQNRAYRSQSLLHPGSQATGPASWFVIWAALILEAAQIEQRCTRKRINQQVQVAAVGILIMQHRAEHTLIHHRSCSPHG